MKQIPFHKIQSYEESIMIIWKIAEKSINTDD